MLSNDARDLILRKRVLQVCWKMYANTGLPFYDDLTLLLLSALLSSRHPSCSYMPYGNMTAIWEWRDEWLPATVTNHSLIAEPSVCSAGFNLPRWLWSTDFRRVRVAVHTTFVKWGQATHLLCSCGIDYGVHCSRLSADSFKWRTCWLRLAHDWLSMNRLP